MRPRPALLAVLAATSAALVVVGRAAPAAGEVVWIDPDTSIDVSVAEPSWLAPEPGGGYVVVTPTADGVEHQRVTVVAGEAVLGPVERVVFGAPAAPAAPTGGLVWTVTATDRTVVLGDAVDAGDHWRVEGELLPITVTDTRAEGSPWTLSGQVSDFTGAGGLPASALGWQPVVLAAGAGAQPGEPVAPGVGLSAPAVLAASAGGHGAGSAIVGAALELRVPIGTPPGDYVATLTITALT